VTASFSDAARATQRPVDGRKACAGCGATYSFSEWVALPLSDTLAREAVQMHLSVPAVWQVERRACRCGAVLSGLVRAVAA
jgi:hypothetical protein